VTARADPIREAAEIAYKARVTTIPVKEDGSKAPDVQSWSQYQTERPTPEQMRAWFANGHHRDGIGAVMGPGGLQGIDFDDRASWARFALRCADVGLGEVLARVCRGYYERTPRGFHLFFYCNVVEGNAKLAQRPKRPEEMDHPNDRVKTLIETRGTGGYFVVAPSCGAVHESGRPYEAVQGSLDHIKTIPEDERAALFDVARSLDQMPVQEARPAPRPSSSPTNEKRPGDDFNRRADWADILQPHGWTHVFTKGVEGHWRRPGKRRGISATTNFNDSGYFYVFTSSQSDFETERGYGKFSVYAILNHDGDFAEAARALATEGYGEPTRNRTQTTPGLSSEDFEYGFGSESTPLDDPEPWGDPTPIRVAAPPPLPLASLPDWLSDEVKAISVATQTPTDLPYLHGMAVLATAVQGKAEVLVRDGYHEPLNLYGLSILPSGSRKSAVVEAVSAPLEVFEGECLTRLQPEIDEAESAKRIAEQRLAKSEKAAAVANSADREVAEHEARAAARDLADIEVPAAPRLLTDDCTPERFGGLLAEQGGRISVHSDEASLFEIALMGWYAQNGASNMEVLLKAHAGSRIRVDRQDRAVQIDKPTATLGISTQPVTLEELAKRPEIRGRGFLARFLFVYPASPIGGRDPDPPAVPARVETRFTACMRRLLEWEGGTGDDGAPAPHTLRLSPPAYRAWLDFVAWLEPQLAEGAALGHMTDWCSKLMGLVPRLSGQIHLAEWAGGNLDSWTVPISGDVMERAIALGRAAIPHAERVFDEMGQDEVFRGARYLESVLRHLSPEHFEDIEEDSLGLVVTKRTIHQRSRGRFPTMNDRFNAAIETLIEHGHLKPVPREGRRVGRPSDRFVVHPWIHPQNTQNPPPTSKGEGFEDIEYGSGAPTDHSAEWEDV